MESVPLGNDPDRRELNELLSLFDAPAYVRRARQVEEAWQQMLRLAERQREEWLAMVGLRLGTLWALAGEWEVLRPLLANERQVEVLEELQQMLQPRLRLPPKRTTSGSVLRRALLELIESLERFNRRWSEYVQQCDLEGVNRLREGYNRYYVLEKACALRSEVLARLGFVPLPLLDQAELMRQLPLLPVPRLTGQIVDA